MKCLAGATLLVLALAPASAQGQDQHRVTLACGTASPPSVAGWHPVADAIVRVRLTGHFAYEVQGREEHDWTIMTEHEGVLVEVYKRHHALLVPGAVQTILQFGGTLQRPEGRRTHTFNAMPPLPAGTEWILFLSWHEMAGGFVVAHFEDGAFGIQDGAIAPLGDSEFATRWRGRPVEELERALLTAAKR